MSPDTAPVVTVNLAPDWFEDAQRAFAALRTRIEHAERELADRRAALEARDLALTEREARFEEAQQSAAVEARALAARAQTVDQELRRIAEQREMIARESESLALGLQELDAALAEVREREEVVQKLETDFAEREAVADRSRRDLETLQHGHEVAYAAARDVFATANQALWKQAQAQGANVPREPPPASALDDALQGVLALREVMETAAASAAARESRAQDLLTNATRRAEEIETIERKAKEEEGRLAGVKADIVNVRNALLAVDAVLLQMPYEVVDNFTKSDAFEPYERAMKAIRRFAD